MGGLADTVIDADGAAQAEGRATGFVFDAATPRALLQAVWRARTLWQRRGAWQRLMRQGMGQDLSWQQPAREYLQLYRTARAAKPA